MPQLPSFHLSYTECHSPVPAISSKSFPLSPIPEDADVQNGITVFPVKSFDFTNTLLFAAMLINYEDARFGLNVSQFCIKSFLT